LKKEIHWERGAVPDCPDSFKEDSFVILVWHKVKGSALTHLNNDTYEEGEKKERSTLTLWRAK